MGFDDLSDDDLSDEDQKDAKMAEEIRLVVYDAIDKFLMDKGLTGEEFKTGEDHSSVYVSSRSAYIEDLIIAVGGYYHHKAKLASFESALGENLRQVRNSR